MAQSNKGKCLSQPNETKVTRRCPCDNKYEFGQLIHEGRFAKLYVVRHFTTKEEFILKAVGVDAADNECIQFVEELMLLRRISHPNIIKIVTYWSEWQEVFSVLPLMAYRSCADVVKDNFPSGLSEKSMGIILSHIIPAIKYLHEGRIIHRAIKGSHILINSHGIAVLSGLKFAISNSIYLLIGYEASLTDMAKCLNWLSPEVHAGAGIGYEYNTDVYSCGITILELCNGEVPFANITPDAMLAEKLKLDGPKLWDRYHLPSSEYVAVSTSTSTIDMTAILEEAYERDQPYEKKIYSKDFQSFTNLCLITDRRTRPTVEQLTYHRFLKAYFNLAPCSLIETLGLTQGLHFEAVQERSSSDPYISCIIN